MVWNWNSKMLFFLIRRCTHNYAYTCTTHCNYRVWYNNDDRIGYFRIFSSSLSRVPYTLKLCIFNRYFITNYHNRRLFFLNDHFTRCFNWNSLLKWKKKSRKRNLPDRPGNSLWMPLRLNSVSNSWFIFQNTQKSLKKKFFPS